MALGLTILASGSSGNSTLLEADGFDVLIDVGLGPRQLAARLATVGVSWPRIRAVLLTHTHGDHWNNRVFAHLLRQRIAVWCHREHLNVLRLHCNCFAAMRQAKLFRTYESGEEFALTSLVRCRPLPVRHDSGATFGFRFDGQASLFGDGWSVGYVSDLGVWDARLVEALADVELLAIEFNHDVPMQLASGRSQLLIDRVLGDEGHLSNVQAAEFLAEIIRGSTPGRLRQLVQLHLSRQCNRPELAWQAAQGVLAASGGEFEIYTARQEIASQRFLLGAREAVSPAA